MSIPPVSRGQIAAAYRFLSPHQAAVLDAATDHLLAGTRVVRCVDGLLSRFEAQTITRRVRVADLRDQHTDGIALLDQLAEGDFTSVSRLRQGLIVRHTQVAPFVTALFDHVVEAIYAPPENTRHDAVGRYHETG